MACTVVLLSVRACVYTVDWGVCNRLQMCTKVQNVKLVQRVLSIHFWRAADQTGLPALYCVLRLFIKPTISEHEKLKVYCCLLIHVVSLLKRLAPPKLQGSLQSFRDFWLQDFWLYKIHATVANHACVPSPSSVRNVFQICDHHQWAQDCLRWSPQQEIQERKIPGKGAFKPVPFPDHAASDNVVWEWGYLCTCKIIAECIRTGGSSKSM